MWIIDCLTSRAGALRGVRTCATLSILLCITSGVRDAPAVTSEELLGTLYLSYLLSDAIPEPSWTLLVDALKEAGTKFPDDPKAKVALLFAEGQLARTRKDLGAARSDFESARELDPADIHPYLGLAELVLDEGVSPEEAKELLGGAMKLLPQAIPEFAHHLYLAKIAGLYRRLGDLLKAIALYESVVARKPDWQHARTMLQQLQMERYHRSK